MRPTLYEKRLLEELLPIARYVQTHYSAGRYISVCWRSGSQQFDAEVTQRGEYVAQGYFEKNGYLEVTLAVHENEYLLRERVNTKGFAFGAQGLTAHGSKGSNDRDVASEVVVYREGEFVIDMARMVLRSICNKIAKPYAEHTTLVVVCTLTMCCRDDEWYDIVKAVRATLPKHRFDAIWMLESVTGHNATLN
jgi:hypothetical protein